MHTHINNFLSSSSDPLLDTSSNFLRITGIFLHRERKLFFMLNICDAHNVMIYAVNPLTLPVAQLFLHAPMVDYGCLDILKKEHDYCPAERKSNLIVISYCSVSDQDKIQTMFLTCFLSILSETHHPTLFLLYLYSIL